MPRGLVQQEIQRHDLNLDDEEDISLLAKRFSREHGRYVQPASKSQDAALTRVYGNSGRRLQIRA